MRRLDEITYRVVGKEATRARAAARQEKRTPGYFAGMQAGTAQVSQEKKAPGYALGKSMAIAKANREKRARQMADTKQRQQELKAREQLQKKQRSEMRVSQVNASLQAAVSMIMDGHDVAFVVDEVLKGATKGFFGSVPKFKGKVGKTKITRGPTAGISSKGTSGFWSVAKKRR